MKDLKKEFPVLSTYTYLNTASCGLLSQSIVDWRRQHDIDLLNGGSVFRDTHREHIQSIRSSVGRFFQATEDEVALIPNFSFGMNTVMDGLPKGLKVLLLEKDYPSVNWTVEYRDFEIFYAKIDENLEDNINQAIAEHQPDVFAFSIVQYTSGIKIDFEFLQQIKAYHPQLLLVADGTQFLGTTSFSFSESPIDVLAASTYKWMLSGYGNGILMIKSDVQDRISPKTIGFNSAEATYSKRDEVAFIRRFEPGHQDTLNFGSLEQSILHFEAMGMQQVSEEISKISKLAKERFTTLGLLDASVVNREEHSNIFNIKGDTALFQKLKDNNIICSLRGRGIRVSFHYYNSEDDLNKLVECLK